MQPHEHLNQSLNFIQDSVFSKKTPLEDEKTKEAPTESESLRKALQASNLRDFMLYADAATLEYYEKPLNQAIERVFE